MKRKMVLTDEDVRVIREVIREEVDSKLEERLSNLPTKNEFYDRMDEVCVELTTTRQEQVALGHQVQDHELRLTSLESTL